MKCFFPPPLFFLFCAIPIIFLETIGSFCQDRLFRFRNIVRSGRRDGFEAHRSVKIREQNVYRWRVLLVDRSEIKFLFDMYAIILRIPRM